MRSMIMAAALISTIAVVSAAVQEDARTAIELPAFLEHMRTQENSLNDVVHLMAKGKIHEAGSTARKEMAIAQAHGFGRYMPPEFREMGFAYHRAADDFARIAANIPEPPDAPGQGIDRDEMLHPVVASPARHDQPRGTTIEVRQGLAIHLVGNQRRFVDRLPYWDALDESRRRVDSGAVGAAE